MSHHVQLEHVIVSERLATGVACVRTLPRVRPGVNFELLRTSESLFADGAHVWLFTCATNKRI